MDPKIILGIIVGIAFFYFRFGPGSRLLKKKSHHHIVPPVPTSDPHWHPIDFTNYTKYLIVGERNQVEKTEELGKLLQDSMGLESAKIETSSKWEMVKIQASNFHDFHQAIDFLTAIASDESYGYCINKVDSSKDYVVKVDSRSDHEYLLGTFRNNQNFGIYLPYSDRHPNGNISLSSVQEVSFEALEKHLPQQLNEGALKNLD